MDLRRPPERAKHWVARRDRPKAASPRPARSIASATRRWRAAPTTRALSSKTTSSAWLKEVLPPCADVHHRSRPSPKEVREVLNHHDGAGISAVAAIPSRSLSRVSSRPMKAGSLTTAG